MKKSSLPLVKHRKQYSDIEVCKRAKEKGTKVNDISDL